jgi:hypothetical protein
MNVPNGLQEINEMFGNVSHFIMRDGTLDPQWNEQYLARCQLPYSLRLSWNRNILITSILCNQLLVTTFANVFDDIVTQGLQTKIIDFGGCFNYRQQRGSNKLSTHAWGIAIDLNPLTNVQGVQGDMDPTVIKIFNDNGFTWGGTFLGKRKDPMHFEYCTGY